MSKDIKFMILQGSVVFNTQRSFFDGEYSDTKRGRNQAFRDLIEKFKNKRIVRISPRITEYVLVYKAPINDDIIYCQLAKKMQIETYRLSDSGINPEQIENYPPLDVFINVDKQQFAVQVVANILTEHSVETIIKHLMNSLTKDFELFINSIQDQKEFWNQVSEDDEIQEISFDLVVPNFFNATGAANELVSSAKEELNADSVGLHLKNKKGKLKANITAIDSFVQYSSMTGAWKLKIKRAGTTKYKVIHSTDCNLKKTIDGDILDLVKKIDGNWHIDRATFDGLVEKVCELFKI